MCRIAGTAIIHPAVRIGRNAVVEDYCIIGAAFRGQADEETIIGDDAVIRSHTVIYAGNVIGKRFQTGNKANIRELNAIGDDVSVGTLSVVEHHTVIESGVRIHTQVFVPEYTILRKECWVGPNVVLTNAKFPKSPDVKNQLRGPLVKERAKIGANSTVLPGITIGENALVGAGSVVTRDVGDHHIVTGNPAKFLRMIDY